MADQSLESRVARLESDVALARSELEELKWREQRAKRDQEFDRFLAENNILMLLTTAVLLVALAHGFKWL